MTEHSAAPPHRTVRTFARSATACSAALWLTVGTWAAPAGATGDPAGATGNPAGATGNPAGATGNPAGSGSADTVSLQVQAQELAGQIEADGRNLDELDAAYNAGQIRLQSLGAQMASLRAGMASATGKVDQARAVLKEQAVLAYLAGGAPVIYLPDRAGQDPSLSLSYAEIVAGGQKRAVADYRSQLQAMSRQSEALQATQQEVSVTLASIRSDQSQAAATLASQQQALSQVKGQLAVLVAQVQQAQQQQSQAQTVSAQLPGRTPNPPAPAPSVGTGIRPGSGSDVPAAAPVPSANRSGTPATPAIPATPAPGRKAAPATGHNATPATARATTTSTTAPAPTGGGGASSSGPVPPQAAGAGAALAYARAQLGKPYQWAGAGPDSFDCSGLVMMAWAQGGVSFPHLAQDQYDMTARIPVSEALPGDLIFFGTPDNVYHVGIYIGNGQMIDAPETGQDVSIQSIYWNSLLGAGRVHT